MTALLSNLRMIRRYPSVANAVRLLDDENRSLVDQAADEILSRIITGAFQPGMSLKSTQLAATLGMSRTPIAGSLARLVDDGVLVQAYNHAAVVGSHAKDWLDHVHRLRQLLEPEAAALAAGRLPEDVIEDFRLLIADAEPMVRECWKIAAMLLDFSLHLAIAEYCGNEPLAAAIRKCWSFKRVSYSLSGDCGENLEAEYFEHVALFEALAAGDAQKARSRMAGHLKNASDTRPSARIV
ncbi:GntR family transcriptional regulator [Aeoliella sp. SH292]|uniref:GntR family transcriptional regulator n=1 Tax=Aeoliella sp. SH292 TaxID=3454464 RepID=UPI003F9D4E12